MNNDPKRREAALLSQAEATVARAIALGADEAEVTVSSGSEFSCAYRGEQLDKLEEASSSGLGLRLWVDGKVAAGSTSDTSDAVVDGLLRELIAGAPFLDRDEHNRLAPAEALDGQFIDLAVYDPATAAQGPEARLAMARQAEAAARSYDPRISATDGASFGAVVSTTATAASNGLRRAVSAGFQSLVADAICDDSDGKKRNGHYGTMNRRLAALKTPQEVGEEAARRAIARIGARKPKTGRMPVVFSREAAPALLGLLTSCATASALWRKRSYLAGRMGEAIASAPVTIVDDPLIPGLLGSSSVDGEGRARRRNVIVDGGRLAMFLAAEYGARRTGLAPTGSASRPMSGRPGESTTNLHMLPGSDSPEAIIAGVGEGIYVEGTFGFGFNAVTGDFSRGAFGRMIRGGQLAEPIAEFTISSDFDSLFGGIEAVGNDLIWDHRSACPTLLVQSMAIGGSG